MSSNDNIDLRYERDITLIIALTVGVTFIVMTIVICFGCLYYYKCIKFARMVHPYSAPEISGNKKEKPKITKNDDSDANDVNEHDVESGAIFRAKSPLPMPNNVQLIGPKRVHSLEGIMDGVDMETNFLFLTVAEKQRLLRLLQPPDKVVQLYDEDNMVEFETCIERVFGYLSKEQDNYQEWKTGIQKRYARRWKMRAFSKTNILPGLPTDNKRPMPDLKKQTSSNRSEQFSLLREITETLPDFYDTNSESDGHETNTCSESDDQTFFGKEYFGTNNIYESKPSGHCDGYSIENYPPNEDAASDNGTLPVNENKIEVNRGIDENNSVERNTEYVGENHSGRIVPAGHEAHSDEIQDFSEEKENKSESDDEENEEQEMDTWQVRDHCVSQASHVIEGFVHLKGIEIANV